MAAYLTKELETAMARTVTGTATYARFVLLQMQVRALLREVDGVSDLALEKISRGLSDPHYIEKIFVYGLFSDGTLGAEFRLEIDWRWHTLTATAVEAQVGDLDALGDVASPSLQNLVRTFNEAVRLASLTTEWTVKYSAQFDANEVNSILGFSSARSRRWAGAIEMPALDLESLPEFSLAVATEKIRPSGSERGDRNTSDKDFRSQSPANGEGANDGGEGPPGTRPIDHGIPHGGRRYLRGQCPDSIAVGKPFSLLASIVLAAESGDTELDPFDVPSEGRGVLLVVHALGLRLLGDQRQTVHVPANGNSSPVMFEFRADAPGPRLISITAWIGGTYLGELIVEITAEHDRPPGPHRDMLVEIATKPADGSVSLVVRYDPSQNAYRFEFRDEDYPHEVTSSLAYDPGPLVEHLIADLDNLAKGYSGYSAAQIRKYLVNAGARLWSQVVPAQLREQFWERQHRIRNLTILADKDVIPWELLYPMDPGHDAGFLVEQFPVTRAIFGRRPTRRLSLRPARFVLPGNSPLPKAKEEIDTIQQMLDPGQHPSALISTLTSLQDLIAAGDFGLLHFACHNTYNPADGSSIQLGNVQFTPMLLTTAAINKALERSAPTVFINACRSAGLNAAYNQLDGWASKFLEAGAGAFIGSLWAVSDGAAREFAQEFYAKLQAGVPLGEAVTQARRVVATQLGDPTWLAYSVYGDPRATAS